MLLRASFASLARLALMGALLSAAPGCGVFSAIANPKAAWALQEPAPMAVILRRADAARATAVHVDRLLVSTAVDKESKWIPKLALKKAEIEASLKDIGGDPDYVVPPGTKGAKLRVVPAEAWARVLSDLCPKESKFPSMFHQVNPEIGTTWGEVAGQARTIAKLKGEVELEVKALDAKDISASDKEAHEKKKKEIEERIEKAEQAYKPKVESFMTKLREEMGKAPPEAKKQIAAAAVSLKRAVEEARLANSVALLRYPLAMPGMPQELKSQAKRIVADVIEDRTGHRPTLEKFEPDIKLEGGSPQFTLNGLPPEAIGGLKPKDLLEEVTKRAKDYVAKVLTLMAYANETQEMLDLQTDVLKTTLAGMDADESKVEGVAEELGDLKVELDGIVQANQATGVKASGKKGKGSRRPVPMEACGVSAAGDGDDDDAEDEQAAAGSAGGKGKAAKGKKGPKKKGAKKKGDAKAGAKETKAAPKKKK